MTYNPFQINAAMAEYLTDPDGEGYAAMQTAVEAAPSFHYPNEEPKPTPPGKTPIAARVEWDALSDADKAQRITDEATRQTVLATQGALWLAAMSGDVAAPDTSSITREQLYRAVDDDEEAALTGRPDEELKKLYLLETLDMTAQPDPSKEQRTLNRIFPRNDNPQSKSRIALDALTSGLSQPKYRALGLPKPYMGLFELLSNKAGART